MNRLSAYFVPGALLEALEKRGPWGGNLKNRDVVASVPAVIVQPVIRLGSLWRRFAIAFAIALIVISAAPSSFASQLVLKSTGGAMTIGTDFVLTGATVANPAGAISIDCPDHHSRQRNVSHHLQLHRRKLQLPVERPHDHGLSDFRDGCGVPKCIGRWTPWQYPLLLHVLGQFQRNRNRKRRHECDSR